VSAPAPLRTFTGPELAPSPAEAAALARVAALPGVTAVAALPDLHVKPQLEAPSSIAAAVAGGVILSLTSPSSGCGMALSALPLTAAELTPARLADFFAALARRLPMDLAALTARPPLIADLTPILRDGAAALAAPDELDHIERRGQAHLGGAPDPAALLAALPAFFLEQARREFGYVGRGNHFVELQVVEEILDPALAAAWGLELGGVTLLLHADSGRLGALTGRLYAHRRKNTPRGRLTELRLKAGFHLRRSRSAAEAWRRLATAFWPRPFTFLPEDELLTQAARLAVGAASNYAFANRHAIRAQIDAALAEVWGAAPGRLIYDVSHNSITPEVVDGAPRWVHRHNASRALPPGHAELQGGPFAASGQPLLLPGTARTSSYLAVSGAGVAASLFSVDHGAGRTAARLGTPRPDAPGARLYDGSGAFSRLAEPLSDAGLEAVVAALGAADLAHPVVRLRPLATWKDRP
jgi:tRNA-splicing ligase RtcB